MSSVLDKVDLQAYPSVSEHCINEILKQIRAGFAPLKVSPPLRLSQWAAKHFYLSAESSQKKQRWEAYPFQIGLLDWMGDDVIEELNFVKSARVGYTKCLMASIGYDAEYKRQNQALWLPTDDDSDSICKTEIEPMLDDVKVMRKVFPEYLKRSKGNTLKLKKFLGSLLHMLGGKAAKNYRRITVSKAKLDEIDGFDQQIENSSDPVTLAFKRLEGATFPKMTLGSTPRIKKFSHIEGRALMAQAFMRYHIDCPHCQAEIALEWGGKDVVHGFKFNSVDFENGADGEVHHICKHCGVGMTQAEYLAIWKNGRWVSNCGQYRYNHETGHWFNAEHQPIKAPRHVAAHIWTAYSPQTTWTQIVREFLQAVKKRKAGDKGPLIGFINETLGETWEDDETERIETDSLKQRAEDYALGTVQNGGLILVTGVDVQSNRFELTTWAIGRGCEMWIVDYQIIFANPADEREWEKLDLHLLQTLHHVNGQAMHIEAAAIDMMGHFTHQGYNFVRTRESRKIAKCFGVRGDPQPGKPIAGRASLVDVNVRGKIIKGGARLWYVGADTAKDLLHGQLSVQETGPGYIHFSQQLPDEFYKQLTAEERVLQKTTAGFVYRWTKPNGARNEVLDCTVYAMFCVYRLGLHNFTEKMWARLESALQPDLFAEPQPINEPTPTFIEQHTTQRRQAKRRRNSGAEKTWL